MYEFRHQRMSSATLFTRKGCGLSCVYRVKYKQDITRCCLHIDYCKSIDLIDLAEFIVNWTDRRQHAGNQT
jgi:hypothetical protein